MKDLIINIEPIISYVVRGINFSYNRGSVNYLSGEERDLTDWFILKTRSSNKAKYPLIFLEPNKIEVSKNKTYIMRNARFIICALTDEKWLRETRFYKNYKEYLTIIANEFYKGVSKSKYTSILEDRNFILEYEYKPKYFVFEDKNPQGDVVDAIEIIVDLEIDTNCLIKENLEICQVHL